MCRIFSAFYLFGSNRLILLLYGSWLTNLFTWCWIQLMVHFLTFHKTRPCKELDRCFNWQKCQCFVFNCFSMAPSKIFTFTHTISINFYHPLLTYHLTLAKPESTVKSTNDCQKLNFVKNIFNIILWDLNMLLSDNLWCFFKKIYFWTHSEVPLWDGIFQINGYSR